VHNVNILDEIMPEAGSYYVMDRGYIDFQRLFVFTLSSAFFVVRTKSNVLIQRRYSHPVDKSTGVRSDQTVILTSFESASAYPDALRRVSYLDKETQKRLKFLTHTNYPVQSQKADFRVGNVNQPSGPSHLLAIYAGFLISIKIPFLYSMGIVDLVLTGRL